MSDSAAVVTLGETMGLLHSDIPAPLAHVSTMALGVGGAESNVAIGLQRLGVNTAWVGRVGRDSLGDRVVRELRAEGVDVHVNVDPDAATGLMLKERRTAQATRVWYYRSHSAGSRLSRGDLPLHVIQSAKVLHVTGITSALSDSAADTVMTGIAAARSAGVSVSFDVNHRSRLWKDRDPAATYREIACQSDIIFAGEDEARLVFPTVDTLRELAQNIANLGPSQVVIKLGDQGCYGLIDGVELTHPAVPILPIDTVGAGNAFVAGYLAEYVSGEDIDTRLRTAVQVGAFACLSPGDWEGLPTRAELHMLTNVDPVSR